MRAFALALAAISLAACEPIEPPAPDAAVEVALPEASAAAPEASADAVVSAAAAPASATVEVH